MSDKSWLKAGLIGTAVAVVISLTGIIPCIGCLLLPIYCIAWFIVPFFTGFFAVQWGKIGNDFGEAAKTGALAGVVLGLVSGVFEFVINVIGSVFNIGTSSVLSTLSDNDHIAGLTFIPLGIGGALICGCVGFILGIILDIAISTLGGIIKSALSK